MACHIPSALFISLVGNKIIVHFTIDGIKLNEQRRKWQPTPAFLPGEFHGQRSMVGYGPWGHRVRYNWAHSTNLIRYHSNYLVEGLLKWLSELIHLTVQDHTWNMDKCYISELPGQYFFFLITEDHQATEKNHSMKEKYQINKQNSDPEENRCNSGNRRECLQVLMYIFRVI